MMAWVSGWCGNLAEAATRRAWYFEQLAAPPLATPQESYRHQASVGALNYSDALASQAELVADLRAVELRVRAGQRFFFQNSVAGTEMASELAAEARHLAVEIARYRANPQGVYGRIGLGLIPFFPQGTTYWQISLSSGVLPSVAVPWDLSISLNAFLSFNRTHDYIVAELGASRRFAVGSGALAAGGFIRWNQSLRPATLGENIMVSLGPKLWAQLGRWGILSAQMPLRVWIDHALVDGQVGFLTDFSSPAAGLEWALFL